MRSYRLSLFCLLAVLAPVAVQALTPFQDEVQRLQQFIVNESGSLMLEQKDNVQQAGTDFFPDDGTEIPAEREGDVNEYSGFVSFRIDGVPYVFKDVPTTQWFAPYVRDVAERGIVSGYKDNNGMPLGIFSPERNVTLEELAKMAVQSAGIQISSCPAEPKNVAVQKTWSAPYISCAEQHAFVLFGDGSEDPHRPATRAEVVVTVLQAFGRAVDGTVTASGFRDLNSSTLFAPEIALAVRDGVVSGYTDSSGNPMGYFGPANPVNRAEISKIISRALQLYAP